MIIVSYSAAAEGWDVIWANNWQMLSTHWTLGILNEILDM